jgi:putative membrane protein insertion efficiency factor
MIVRFLDALIQLYQRTFSRLLPAGTCRFHPTCSAYAREALRLHGAARGSLLSFLRLCRCQPFHRGGLDPVPLRHPARPALPPEAAP